MEHHPTNFVIYETTASEEVLVQALAQARQITGIADFVVGMADENDKSTFKIVLKPGSSFVREGNGLKATEEGIPVINSELSSEEVEQIYQLLSMLLLGK
jgi:hypothetical protein